MKKIFLSCALIFLALILIALPGCANNSDDHEYYLYPARQNKAGIPYYEANEIQDYVDESAPRSRSVQVLGETIELEYTESYKDRRGFIQHSYGDIHELPACFINSNGMIVSYKAQGHTYSEIPFVDPQNYINEYEAIKISKNIVMELTGVDVSDYRIEFVDYPREEYDKVWRLHFESVCDEFFVPDNASVCLYRDGSFVSFDASTNFANLPEKIDTDYDLEEINGEAIELVKALQQQNVEKYGETIINRAPPLMYFTADGVQYLELQFICHYPNGWSYLESIYVFKERPAEERIVTNS